MQTHFVSQAKLVDTERVLEIFPSLSLKNSVSDIKALNFFCCSLLENMLKPSFPE